MQKKKKLDIDSIKKNIMKANLNFYPTSRTSNLRSRPRKGAKSSNFSGTNQNYFKEKFKTSDSIFKTFQTLKKSQMSPSNSRMTHKNILEISSLSTVGDVQNPLSKTNNTSKNFMFNKFNSSLVYSPLNPVKTHDKIFFKVKKENRSYLSKVKLQFRKDLELIGKAKTSGTRTRKSGFGNSSKKEQIWQLDASNYSVRSKSPCINKYNFQKKKSLGVGNMSSYSKNSGRDSQLMLSRTSANVSNLNTSKGNLDNLFSILTKKKKVNKNILRKMRGRSSDGDAVLIKSEIYQKEIKRLAQVIKEKSNQNGKNSKNKFGVRERKRKDSKKGGSSKPKIDFEREKKSLGSIKLNKKKSGKRKMRNLNVLSLDCNSLFKKEAQANDYPASSVRKVTQFLGNLQPKDCSGLSSFQKKELTNLALLIQKKLGMGN